MNAKSRAYSILQAKQLDASITGCPIFSLTALEVLDTVDAEIPKNLRLGHLAERVVAQLIRSSANYKILHENLQVIDGNHTIGELDFIIQHKASAQVTHLELAYKFYLYDPSLSAAPINNWIGPNRNDSLREKLHKVKNKQFPLLFDERTVGQLEGLDLKSVSQALCLLVNLYIPYEYSETLAPAYQKAVRGYYLDQETFLNHHLEGKTYYLPPKKEWGMDPSLNTAWAELEGIAAQLAASQAEHRAVLCWQNDHGRFSEFFVTWW